MHDTIGQYRILDRLGTGGAGESCRARDLRHGRTVILTILRGEAAEDAAARSQFLEAARGAAALSHPNIAAVYEAGEESGAVFAALEYVPGETLHATIGGRPLNPRRAADYAGQLADALAAGHALGVVHGGLRADTVVITPKGNAKLLDYGLRGGWTGALGGALPPDAAADAASYVAPEQLEGRPADERGDVFALGVLLFAMLTGAPPGSGAAGAPLPFGAVVAKALASDPDQRYQSAAAFAGDLREAAAALPPPAAHVPPLPRRPPSPARRGMPSMVWWVLLMVAATAALLWLVRW
jgi:serine/threonine-protein kinase